MASRKNINILMFFLMIDIIFLRWVWVHFENWGFWDWDFQQALLETSRRSVLQYHQLPLWNPFMGGGTSLAGDTLNHVWGPAFLPILLFGTIAGIKLDIFVYLIIAQFGMFLLARNRGLADEGACLSAILFTVGGVFAHRLTHGHFEWIAIAWMPYIVLCIDKSVRAFDWRIIGFASLAFAFLILDGGPYQFAFFGIFSVAYAGVLAIQSRNRRVFWVLAIGSTIGILLASIKVFPMLELVMRYPRITEEINFYNAPFTPTALQLLAQSFISRAQYHRPEAWMPYILNVGCYIGWIPIVLASFAAIQKPKRNWPLLAVALMFLWFTLGPAAPIDIWHIVNRLPGFSGLRVPSRFNVFVLLMVALLAGEGLHLIGRRTTQRKWLRLLPVGILALVTVDLVSVNGKIFKVAFSVPPTTLKQHQHFQNYSKSPFLAYYKAREFYRISPHWQSGVFPAILENRGVIETLQTIPFPNNALPFDHPSYRGEAWIEDGQATVLGCDFTPNRIRVETDGGGGRLFINVNYDPGWRLQGSSSSRLFAERGLLAIDLTPGVDRVEVVYLPHSFVIGAATSLIVLFAGIGAVVLRQSQAHVTNNPMDH